MTNIAMSGVGPPAWGRSLSGRIVAVDAAERSLGSGIARQGCHDLATDGTVAGLRRTNRTNDDGGAVLSDGTAAACLTSLGAGRNQGFVVAVGREARLLARRPARAG